MAKDYIKIDVQMNGAKEAQNLVNAIGQLRMAYESLTRVKAKMFHNFDGADVANIEALYGLPTGSGQSVLDLVNGSVGAMEGTFQNDDCKQLTEQVG